MSFHVGQEVICVDDSGISVPYAPRVIKRGDKYVVSGYCDNGNPLIAGYPNPNLGRDAGWLEHRFRAIDVRKTDISIFTEMLKPRELVRSHD